MLTATPLVVRDAAHPGPRVGHVGLGDDYDGIEGAAPVGMTRVDGYPPLFAQLARRGWSNADLAKLAGGNRHGLAPAFDPPTRIQLRRPPQNPLKKLATFAPSASTA